LLLANELLYRVDRREGLDSTVDPDELGFVADLLIMEMPDSVLMVC
jgi:hypothetical protein